MNEPSTVCMNPAARYNYGVRAHEAEKRSLRQSDATEAKLREKRRKMREERWKRGLI